MSAHILVVDDEPDISALVAYHLARESYRIRTVGNGGEALRAIEAEQPELIVLDLMLPETSGLEFCVSCVAALRPLRFPSFFSPPGGKSRIE